jgi:cyclomaltodextrinase / maltogenic alpha-amylase / neopullulanase
MKTRLSFLFLLFIFLTAQAQDTGKVYTHPEWSYNKTIYEANIRQFSEEGTFDKFREYIPELKEMGIGIIWLMPIHPIGVKNRKGSLGSYYSVKDYLDVNSEFGTKEDFKELVDEIHKNEMYVIIDWIANHTAWDNNLTEEHPEWFTKDSAGNFVPPVADWSDVIDLNYDEPGLHRYMTDALLYWVKEFDIDGYRCDVAEMVPLEFWKDARRELDAVKPVFMLAEGEQADLHEAFDMTYSWEIFNIMKDIAKDNKTAEELHKYLELEYNKYPDHAFRMRFTTNHDENSWNGTEEELFGEGAETYSAATVIIPGMPLLYTGQETGLNKRLAFFERDPVEWKESPLRDVYSTLFNLKQNHPALYNGEKGGEYIPIRTTDDKKVFAFIREKGTDKIFALFNLSPEEKNIKVNNSSIEGSYKALFTDKQVNLKTFAEFKLKPWEYRILVSEKK